MSESRPTCKTLPAILLLLCGLLSVSCIPIVTKSPAFPVDAEFLTGVYADQRERMLVLPVWRNYPALASEHSIRESSTLAFGDPLILPVAELYKLHNLVPGRSSAGMVLFPLAAVGRGVDFYGYTLIGESGRMTWVRPGYPKSRVLMSVYLSQDDKDELLRTFREVTEVPSPRASPFWQFIGKLKLSVDYSEDQRDQVVGFLQGIDDEITGRGLILYLSGDRYEGEYIDGRPHGQGAIKSTGGHRYEGAWIGGVIQGRGTYVWSDGMRYDGELVNGKPEGRGKMVRANGDWYDGEWHDGYAEGEGSTMIDGRNYEGTWSQGCLSGKEVPTGWGLPARQCR